MQVMIRPRTGDFVYEEGEIAVMLQDIAEFKKAGASGFVFGVLEPDGAIDVTNTTRFVGMPSYYLQPHLA
jgi:copper homeostasis protein